MNHLDFESSTPEGVVPFRAVLTRKGKVANSVVGFYDRRYEFTPDGQFTGGSYYVHDFTNGDGSYGYGIQLYGGVTSWYLDSKACKQVKAWLEGWAD